jgi:hypothetical protein
MWAFLSKIMDYLFGTVLIKLDTIITSQNKIKELIMGLKEDFVTFTTAVNERTNEIAAALEEIKADIEGLLNPTTPPETVVAMAAIQEKLQMLSDASKAIAALNNPVVPPPIEPL